MSMNSNFTLSSVPFDVFAEIINLLSDANPTLFKLRLCSKLWMRQTLRALKKVTVVCFSHPLPSDFVGCKPSIVKVSGFPYDEHEAKVLGELISTASELVQDLSSVQEPYRRQKALSGHELKNIKNLTFHTSAFTDLSLAFIRWLPHLAQLEALTIYADLEMISIMEAVSQHCSALQKLALLRPHEDRLFHSPRHGLRLSQIAENLQKMTSLSSITLTQNTAELGQLRNAFWARGASKANLELDLARFVRLLPAQLHDFEKISIQDDESADMPLLGHICRDSKSASVKDFLFEKLKTMDLNNISPGWRSAMNAWLKSGNVGPTRFRELLHAGLDIFAPTVRFHNDTGNLFHLAVREMAPDTASEVLHFVDWNSITDIAPFRTSSGYTPLHFQSKFLHTWRLFYNVFKQRFPEILLDAENIHQAPPLMAIHMIYRRQVVEPQVCLAIFEFMIAENPQLLSSLLPSGSDSTLFARIFQFYSYEHKTGKIETVHLLRQLLEHHCRCVGVAQASELDYDSLRLAKINFEIESPALMLARDLDVGLFAKLLPSCTADVLARNLRAFIESKDAVDLFNLSNVVALLVNAGADLNATGTDPHLLSILGTFIDRRTPVVDKERGEAGSHDAEEWRVFWSTLWFLVDHGATLSADKIQDIDRALGKFGRLISRKFSHPLYDLARFFGFVNEWGKIMCFDHFLAYLRLVSRPEAQPAKYYGALYRKLLRTLKQPLPADSPSEEYDLEILKAWSPERGPPRS